MIFLRLIHALVNISDKNYTAEWAGSLKYKYFVGSQVPNRDKIEHNNIRKSEFHI
jgi:hypothetical protein